jgi:hypothetical protein
MGALTPADQRRLQGSLARLASPHEGEIIAAVAAVRRILDKVGARFSDLELPTAPMAPSRCEHARPCHCQRAEELLNGSYEWSEWAVQFLEGIAAWRAPLSERQAAILAELEHEAVDPAA